MLDLNPENTNDTEIYEVIAIMKKQICSLEVRIKGFIQDMQFMQQKEGAYLI